MGPQPPKPLLAVPNVTAHPSTASVPITVLLYNGLLLSGFNASIRGLTDRNLTHYLLVSLMDCSLTKLQGIVFGGIVIFAAFVCNVFSYEDDVKTTQNVHSRSATVLL